MARGKKPKRTYITHQSLPALASVVFGVFMMVMPFVVSHSGYIDDVLIASPSLKPPFDKTLIFIGEESVDGSIGIILNKPLSESQHAALSPFMRDSGIPVGYGGPIEVSEKIFVLEEKHTDPPENKVYFDINTWDDAVRDTPDLLEKIRASLRKGEQRYRVFTGYAGWGAFQLETEAMLRKKWHNIAADHDLIFQNGSAATWDALNDKITGKGAKPPAHNQI